MCSSRPVRPRCMPAAIRRSGCVHPSTRHSWSCFPPSPVPLTCSCVPSSCFNCCEHASCCNAIAAGPRVDRSCWRVEWRQERSACRPTYGGNDECTATHAAPHSLGAASPSPPPPPVTRSQLPAVCTTCCEYAMCYHAISAGTCPPSLGCAAPPTAHRPECMHLPHLADMINTCNAASSFRIPSCCSPSPPPPTPPAATVKAARTHARTLLTVIAMTCGLDSVYSMCPYDTDCADCGDRRQPPEPTAAAV